MFVAIAEKAVTISTELNTAWASGDVKRKEQLQKLLFPEGIVYDLKNNTFRTDRVNVIFMLMAQLANNTGAKEKGQTNALAFVCPFLRTGSSKII